MCKVHLSIFQLCEGRRLSRIEVGKKKEIVARLQLLLHRPDYGEWKTWILNKILSHLLILENPKQVHDTTDWRRTMCVGNFAEMSSSFYTHIFQPYLQGSSLNLVTPTDETRMILLNDLGNASTRFLTPSQSEEAERYIFKTSAF